MNVIAFDNVSKKYKLYSKGGLYLRDRVTHALGKLNPFNGTQHSSSSPSPVSGTLSSVSSSLSSVTPLEHDFWALKNVSFEIEQGESVGFIGRNGAGKSTILKLLAGVTKPSSGNVEVNGRVAAMIEVGAGFHPELTGRENIFLNGSILGMKKVEMEKSFDSIVSFAELEEFIETPVKHYSSGMYVRLGFAIAAHTNPDIYLIDEVLAVGDEAFQKKCLDTLASHKDAGKTLILVSHNLQKVEEICDRCIYVNHGEVRHDGLPSRAIQLYREDLDTQSLGSNATDDSLGREVKIKDVILRDSAGRVTSAFRTDEDVVIEICYHAYRTVENPVVGLAIIGPNGEHITGFNTREASVCIKEFDGEGSIFCKMPNIPLHNGTYWISASVTDFALENIYDLHWARYRLDIKSDTPHGDGLIHIENQWSKKILNCAK